jgi:PAS domain S-box-containing protein
LSSSNELETVRQDGEFILYRGLRQSLPDGSVGPVLVLAPASERPSPETLGRMEHELSLKSELDPAWAVRPLGLAAHQGRSTLRFEDPGGEPLERLLGGPMDLALFLRLAVGLAAALGEVHRRGVIHKDIKPAHVLVDAATGRVWLTGFGIASRLSSERQTPESPETIAGTLAYMAPEQTGRMNRSIDTRSDLYALGVTLYQMLTGSLPFAAVDPMEWVHCHIARQPTAPRDRVGNVPSPISAIVMKLLAKMPEERYQTAAGLERDLGRCLAEWEAERSIGDFPPGERDTPDRLLIPEKLYGREGEIETLLAAFERIVDGGAPELVLLSGYSGIGKSSLINELHKVLVPPRGLFASGKFDQYKRDIPYATVAQAFQSLIRPILARSEDELGRWRDAIREALGANGQIIVDLVPELKLIIGEQPPVPEVPAQDAHLRFQLVFRRFLGVFARPEHPLALFLDDLQWLDAATVDLLEDMVTQTDVRHLLLIGAYRDNEVTSAHPLMCKLEEIRRAGAPVKEMVLAPLAREDVGRLIADTFHCDPARAAPLAQRVHEKTAGNPFFAIQFLSALVEEGLVAFDHAGAHWSWDLGRIDGKGYTDNVVDLMVGKLRRLPALAQDALGQLASLGNSAESSLLAMVYADSRVKAHDGLQDALRSGLVIHSPGGYRFLHDRVQEAAYSLIPEGERAGTHLRIGRLLAAQTPPEKREEAIFEIVSQLNRGAALITSREEREQLAELNLTAGKRAVASTAYASALSHLVAGVASLADDGWEHRPELMFALELRRAECEHLTGELTSAEARLTSLSSRAANLVERADAAGLLAHIYFALQRPESAVASCLACLRHAGLDIPAQPTKAQAQAAYDHTWSKLEGRSIDELVELPLATDPASRAIIDVVAKVLPSAVSVDLDLACVLVCRAIDLSLERGHCDASCYAYALFAYLCGSSFGTFEARVRLGRLSYELARRKGLRRFEAHVTMVWSSCVLPWAEHVGKCRDLLRQASEVADELGDRVTGVASRGELVVNLLVAGEPLVEVEKEAEVAVEFCRKAAYGDYLDAANMRAAFIRNLRGLSRAFGSLDDDRYDERRIQDHFATQPHVLAIESWYWTHKLMARFLAGDYTAALAASIRAQDLLWSTNGVLEAVECEFYSALTRAAVCDGADGDERRQHLEAAAALHRQLEDRARHGPENFANRAALVGAEIARIEGRELDAERLYEEAIRSARESGFVHNEALASELAARFHAARGFEIIAHAYLRNARRGYLRWGADGKVRQLDRLHPHLRTETTAPATGTIQAPVEHLDLATVIKVSQAVSGETVLEKLLDTLMRTAIEYAGAERALLILSREAERRIAAEATTGGDTVVVRLRDEPVTPAALPESVLHLVLRTREAVLLEDASSHSPMAADPYIHERHARSIVALPLVTQAKLIGALYLENNLAPRVFGPGRVAVLKLLASQAATALENAHLYRDLAEREAKIRRLVDANIIGILIWDLDGRILDANLAFLSMLGYSRADLAAGMRWTEMTPADWREPAARVLAAFRKRGLVAPFETEYFRKDGSRVPVLTGAATFEEGGSQGVAFVLDLTERKRSEEALREMRAELAHVARLTSLGEMAASIAHELNQPLSGIATNAGASLRWLAASNVDEARRSAEMIRADAHRGAEIIQRIRLFAKKAPPQRDWIDIDQTIREVVALASSEVQRHDVSVDVETAADVERAPLVFADRIQLQQVVLNLMMNAAEAMSEVTDGPRELRIRTGVDASGHVVIAVRDSGAGLSPEHQDRLFVPFYTTKPQGLGMGLAISRSIVEAHGGRLWATANPDRGATFQFTVPTGRDRTEGLVAESIRTEPSTTRMR